MILGIFRTWKDGIEDAARRCEREADACRARASGTEGEWFDYWTTAARCHEYAALQVRKLVNSSKRTAS